MNSSTAKVAFHYVQVKFTFKHRQLLKRFILQLFSGQAFPLGGSFQLVHARTLERLDIIFCDDEYLLNINKEHLQHDFYTDIITFDLSPNPQSITPAVGEMYISIDRVRENAALHGATLQNECERVVLHGCLHLLGFKDKRKKEESQMRAAEDFLLEAYTQYINGAKQSY